jgi:hypothetical protein
MRMAPKPRRRTGRSPPSGNTPLAAAGEFWGEDFIFMVGSDVRSTGKDERRPGCQRVAGRNLESGTQEHWNPEGGNPESKMGNVELRNGWNKPGLWFFPEFQITI